MPTADDPRTVVAERVATEIVANTGVVDPSLVEELHQRFSNEEVTDLLISIAHFIGNTLIMKALGLE